MPSYFPNLEDELAELEAKQRRVRASDARMGAISDENGRILPGEDGGARFYANVYDLSEYQKRYPWLGPRVIKGLAEYGLPADAQTAKVAAELGAKIKLDSGLYFHDSGRAVKVKSLTPPKTISDIPSTGPERQNYSSAVQALHIYEQGLGTAYVGAEPKTQLLRDFEKQRYISQNVASGDVYEFTDDAPEDLKQIKKGKGGGGGGGIVGARSAAGLPSITPIARASFMVLDAPIQELQGGFRNLASGQLGGLLGGGFESQSDLGVSLGKLSRGESVDVGSGMFVDPESEVSKERIRRAMERGNIGGHTITPGRWIADLVLEPGSKPYSLLSGVTDLAIAIGADPSNIALAGAGKARMSSKLFTEAGGITGLRRTVSPAAVDRWMAGKPGQKVVQWLVDHDQTYDVFKGLNRRVDPETAHQLADARTADQVQEILRPKLGSALREKPTVPDGGPFSLQATRSKHTSRLLEILPQGHIDLEDPMDALTQVERTLHNVHASPEMVYEFTDKMARTTNRIERFNVLEEMWGGVKGVLVNQYNVAPEMARKLTRMKRDSYAAMFKGTVDDIGNPERPWVQDVAIDGVSEQSVNPFLIVEHIARHVSQPDPRALRRVTSRLRPIVSNKYGQLRLPAAAAEAVQQRAWKPLTLLRGAWTVRVVGEEQVRMAANGLASMVNHPAQAISWIIGRKGNNDILGKTFADSEEFLGSLTRGSAGLLGQPGQIVTGDWRIVAKSAEELSDYKRGWAEELAQLYADPIGHQVATFDNLDDAKAWFRDDPRGIALRKLLIDAGHPELETLSVPGRVWKKGDKILSSDDYIDALSHRISTKTGGNAELINVIRTGKLRDFPIDLSANGQMRLNSEFVDALDSLIDAGPQAVKGSILRTTSDSGLNDRLNQMTEFMFGVLMSKPTNYLSRSSTFKQMYWNRVPELVPFMTIDAQQAVIKAAKDAGIKGDLLRAMSKARKETGELTLDHADFYAKGYALDETKKLLYDLTQRTQFFDSARLILPFGEAWKEIFQVWGRTMVKRPQTIRRFQQLVQGARGPGFGELAGAPTVVDPETGVATQQGFFHENAQGEEVFVYPGSQWLTSSLVGVPIPLAGRVQGLNMVAQIWPALGPMAQIPVAAFIPDDPKFDAVNDILFPFGRPEGSSTGNPFQAMFNSAKDADNWTPAWLQRFLNRDSDVSSDPEAMRMWNNSVMEVVTYLASTGEYDTATPEGVQKLYADAKSKAGAYYWIRSAAQFASPSAPAPEWLVNTKANGLIPAAMLAQEFRAMQETNYETSAQLFLEKYGTEAFTVMQSKTHSVVYGYPVTDEGVAWMESNSSVKTDYAHVFGFFAPQGGEFSYPAYLRSIRDGARQPLDGEQFLKLSNARLAAIEFRRLKDDLNKVSGGKPSDEQRAWLKDWKETLMDEYPGYREQLNHALGLITKADDPQLFHELEQAAEDPIVLATPAGQALREYMGIRALALSSAEDLGLSSYNQAKSARHLRDWLREWGNTLSEETPDFLPLWEQILEPEMYDDLDEVGQ